MTSFTPHDLQSAPEKSRPLLEDSAKAFGRIPGLHAVMAEAPALLDGYKHLHRLFAQETSFDKDELTVVWQTINVEHECHYCVPAHTGIAKMMKVDDASLMPLAVPTQWNALRSMSPVEAIEPATMPCARSSATIMLPK